MSRGLLYEWVLMQVCTYSSRGTFFIRGREGNIRDREPAKKTRRYSDSEGFVQASPEPSRALSVRSILSVHAHDGDGGRSP